MTTTYYEFIGKEPSLNDLHEFVENHNELFDNINVRVINEYLKFCKDYYGYYYVGGQIKILPTEPITTEIINKAREINDKAQPYHMAEVSSLLHSKNNLNNLEKILNVYYEYKLMEYYAPPPISNADSFGLLVQYNNITEEGEGYKKIAAETIIGKNISKP
jgi:hypothetical protein